MSAFQKVSLVLLRVSLGWLFLYAGATKIMNPTWSAAGYLNGAKTFHGFYAWLASPSMIGVTNFVNEWALALIGLLLIAGFLVRYASYAGAAMMFLYYLPILDFPYPNTHSYLVDEHIIYLVAFLALAAFDAGRVWGVDARVKLVGRS